jgi:hypothetical protein
MNDQDQAEQVARILLTDLFNKALGIAGPGLAALGITPSGNTPELMAGVALYGIHFLISRWNLKRALATQPTQPKPKA